MVRSSVLLTLASAVSTAFAAIEKVGTNKQASARVPGAYIFEFEEGSDTKAFFVKTADEQARTRIEYDYQLFKGASIQFDDVENAEDKATKLAALPAVKNVWPVTLYSIPKPDIEWIGKPEVESATSRKVKRATNDTTGDTFSTHVMTQVDKLRAEGITGKGIKIAVIDTGIDYKHPALGGCYGPNCLVTFGTDLVGDGYTGANKPVPDDDPMDCQGHGTHVAGIIAAQENSWGFTGAAPGVSLGAYRVFGCEGEAANDVLIAAYNRAFEDGADIITASIGGPSGWSEDEWAVAVTRIVDQGVPCTVAAGNEGDVGLFYASTASNGKRVTSIASFDNTKSVALLTVSHYSVDGGDEKEFGYTPSVPAKWDGIKLPLFAPDLDPKTPNGGCDPYPEDTPDLSKNIVLVRRGACPYTQKAQNAADKGAKYFLVYNNAPGASNFDVTQIKGIVAAGMVTADQGEEWIKLLTAGSEVVLRVDNSGSEVTLLEVDNLVTGGALSGFTTWGPTWEVDVKPQFGAPGGSILSTYPTALGSYAVLSGTSMACPLTAAIVALVAQVRGTLDPKAIETLLSANANPQLFNDGKGFSNLLAPVPQQGGGLVQAWDAAHAKTLLTPSSFSFNDTDHFVKSQEFTLSNTGSEEVTYEISHVPAITMYTLVNGEIYPAQFPNEQVAEYASFEFSQAKVTLGAGQRRAIQAVATPPSDLDAKRLPVWSGYVAINGTDGTSLSLPYQGVTGSLHGSTVLGKEDTWISQSTDAQLKPVPDNTAFTLPRPGTPVAGSNLPVLTWFLALGTAELRADLIPVKGKESSYNKPVKSLGQPRSFPFRYSPNGANRLPWTGEMEDGSYAPSGSYKIRFSALHIFGDANKKGDWDVSETGVFSIKYAK